MNHQVIPPFPERCAQILTIKLTVVMVIKETEDLDEKKSMDPDKIHAKMLKELKDLLQLHKLL